MNNEYSEKPIEGQTYEVHERSLPVQDTIIVDSRPTYEEKKRIFRSYYLVWYVIGLINAVLAFRFVFEFLGANPYNVFVQLIYSVSYPFAAPFQTILGITNFARSVFDWSLLIAIAVYFLIGYGLTQLIKIMQPIPHEQVHRRVRTV